MGNPVNRHLKFQVEKTANLAEQGKSGFFRSSEHNKNTLNNENKFFSLWQNFHLFQFPNYLGENLGQLLCSFGAKLVAQNLTKRNARTKIS